jgi:hypothetical protein
VPLRIAFDLDGVFADMQSALARQATALFGPDDQAVNDSGDGANPARVASEPAAEPPRAVSRPERDDTVDDHASHPPAESPAPVRSDEPPLVRLQITTRQQRQLWKHVEEVDNFWETLDEIEPGSLARLSDLSESRRWEIIFLTKRPGSAGATAQVQSQRWLNARGFAWPSVFVVQGSRGRIAASLALDIVVDDTPENCLDVVVDSKARAVLVWRDERPPPVAVKRLGIGVVKSVEECLNIFGQVESSSREGVMDRVKRLLGTRGRRRAKSEA